MATTYGYSGEFSSDEDIDRLEQQAERLTQAKFDSQFGQPKPSKSQVEKAIDTIRRSPIEHDFSISDELLAALLDYYKTKRGPIVDSTRNLYKKIVLRLIRGDQPAANGEQIKESNGAAVNNNNNDNNNSKPLVQGQARYATDVATNEVGSSDDDEPMPPVFSQTALEERSNLDSRTVVTEVASLADKLKPMEVDSEQNLNKQMYRDQRQTVDELNDEHENDDDDDDSDKTESSSDDQDEETSDSEVLDVTPVKPGNVDLQTNVKSTGKQIEPSATKKQARQKQLQQDTTPQKKPYTRSQRVAATRASSAIKSSRTDVSSSKVDGPIQTDSVSSAGRAVSKTSATLKGVMQPKVLIPTVLVVLVAVLLFFFRSDLSKATGLFSRSIKF